MSHGSSAVVHNFVRVDSDLENIVGKSEKRSQRKGSNEDCNETKLNHWGKRNHLLEWMWMWEGKLVVQSWRNLENDNTKRPRKQLSYTLPSFEIHSSVRYFGRLREVKWIRKKHISLKTGKKQSQKNGQDETLQTQLWKKCANAHFLVEVLWFPVILDFKSANTGHHLKRQVSPRPEHLLPFLT